MEASELTLRPVRPADRERVLEITADIWDGHDYLPSVFDDWVADPSSTFQAVEVEGVVAGLQRTRPLNRQVAFYEGLRVASSHRRLGLARAMLGSAVAEATSAGFLEMRLVTGNLDAIPLFESLGFRRLCRMGFWHAGRVEGGEPARIPAPTEAPDLFGKLAADPALGAYGGTHGDWQRPLPLDAAELAALAAEGRLRAGAGGRSLAILRAGSHTRLYASLVSGSGAGLRDLLMALRFEADADNLEGATVIAPLLHPAAADFRAVGYDDPRDGEDGFFIYALRLKP